MSEFFFEEKMEHLNMIRFCFLDESVYLFKICDDIIDIIFLIEIHSMQVWTANTKHRVTRKRWKSIGNFFRKNQEPKDKMSLLNYFYR